MVALTKILEWFQAGLEPSESQFRDTWISFWHKSEKLPQTQILGLNDALKDKASKDDLAKATTMFKGYHTSLAELQTEYPQPGTKKDWFAWVGSPYPGTVWKIGVDGGAWTNTGEVPTQEEIDLAEYAKNGGSNKTVKDLDDIKVSYDILGMSQTFILPITKGGYQNKQGQLITDNPSSPNFSYTDFEESTDSEFSVSDIYITANVAEVCLFDDVKNFLQEYIPTKDVFFKPSSINSQCAFVRFSFNTLAAPDVICMKKTSGVDGRVALEKIENGDSLVYNQDKLLLNNESIVDFLQLNTLPVSFIEDYYWNAVNGVLTPLVSWLCTPKMSMQSINYLFVKGFTSASRGYVLYFDKNGAFVKYIKPNISSPDTVYKVIIDDDYGFISFNLGRNVDGFTFDQMKSYFKISVNGDFNNMPLLTGWRIPKASVVNDDGSVDIKNWTSLGTSITWQDGKAYGQASKPNYGQIARGYQTQVNEKYNLSFLVNNQGRSGYAMAGATASISAVGLTLDYSSADLITIEAATNDFRLNKSIGEIGSVFDSNESFDLETFYGAYRRLLNYIIFSNQKARIVLLTPIHRTSAGYTIEYINSAGHKLIDYANAVKAIGEMYSLQVIDLYNYSGINTKNLDSFTMDGLHPDDEGYRLMAEAIVREL